MDRECLTCNKCGKVFTEEEHKTELCDDDICRDCHSEEYTFGDCWTSHRLTLLHWKGAWRNTVDRGVSASIHCRCPRCKERVRMNFYVKGNSFKPNCPKCDFENEWDIQKDEKIERKK